MTLRAEVCGKIFFLGKELERQKEKGGNRLMEKELNTKKGGKGKKDHKLNFGPVNRERGAQTPAD